MEESATLIDASAASWLTDIEMEDYNLFPQCHLGLLDVDDEEFLSHDIVASAVNPLCSKSYSSYHGSTDETSLETPTQQLKTNSWNSSNITEHFSPELSPSYSPTTSLILSFENSNSSHANTNTIQFYGFDDDTLNPKQNEFVSVSQPTQLGNTNFTEQTRKGSSENQNMETKNPQSQGTKRSPAHAQDHIMAERKRREKQSQSLIALAALIPGLKKIDKATVVGEAIKYIKDLQERMRLLEKGSNKRAVAESVVIVNKPQLKSGINDSSSCQARPKGLNKCWAGPASCDPESFDATSGSEALPHVDARVSDNELLLRIHCQKQKGLLAKILDHIQNLHLFVVNSSVLPYGNSIIDITIVAQMGTGYNLTIKDLVRNLRVATLKSMS